MSSKESVRAANGYHLQDVRQFEDFYWPRDGHEIDAANTPKCNGANCVGGGSYTPTLRVARTRYGIDFDMPTETEWEFACRGGKGSALYTGDEISSDSVTVDEKGVPTLVNPEPTLEKIARYYLNSDAANIADPSQVTDALTGTARVGSYEPNAWGLYDMIGNVGEWVLDNRDNFAANTKEEPLVDPVGKTAETLNDKVIRGGAWNSSDLR